MTKLNEDWEYDGVNLTTYAYYIKALGAAEQVPARRGENVVIPARTGRHHVSKKLDERRLALGMQVTDRHPTTGAASAMQLKSNVDALKKLFAKEGQHTLKHQLPGTETRQAEAEVAGVVEFQPGGPAHYDLLVEFVLADPLWYAGTATTVGPTMLTQSPQNITVTNPGTWQSEQATITATGPMVDPKFTIGAVWVQYAGTVSAGGTLTLDCSDWTAMLGTANVGGGVTHSGALRWLVIPTGANTFTVTGSAYDASTAVTVTFTAPYL